VVGVSEPGRRAGFAFLRVAVHSTSRHALLMAAAYSPYSFSPAFPTLCRPPYCAGHALSASAALLGSSLHDLDHVAAQISAIHGALHAATQGLTCSTAAAVTGAGIDTGDKPTTAASLTPSEPEAPVKPWTLEPNHALTRQSTGDRSAKPRQSSGDSTLSLSEVPADCGSLTAATNTKTATPDRGSRALLPMPSPERSHAAAAAEAAHMQLCLQQQAQIAALTASLASRDALLAQAQAALACLQDEARGVAGQLREDAGTIESACDTLHVVINE